MKQITLEIFRSWPTLMMSDRDPDRVVNEASAGKVEISDQAGHSVLLSFNTQTGLPESEIYAEPGAPGEVQEAYADWQEVDGVKFPRKITLIRDAHHFADLTVSSEAVNGGLTVEQISKKP
jgi:hypothetical protein